jgi:hypothetical protein
MTSPTQAQVEAALDEALYSLCCDDYETQQEVAARLKPLTAAAGVGRNRQLADAYREIERLKVALVATRQELTDMTLDRNAHFQRAERAVAMLDDKAALAAAAAGVVGELPSVNFDKHGKPYSYCPECGRQDNYLDAITIERCALVADGMAYVETCADDTANGTANAAPYRKVATAIRAVRDEP